MTNKDMLYLGLTEDDLEIGKCSIIEITRDDLVDFLDEFGLRLVNHTEIPPIALCDWHDMVLNRHTRKLYKFNNWMIRASVAGRLGRVIISSRRYSIFRGVFTMGSGPAIRSRQTGAPARIESRRRPPAQAFPGWPSKAAT